MSFETMYCFGGPADGQCARLPARTTSIKYRKLVEHNPTWQRPVTTIRKVSYHRERFSAGQQKLASVLVANDYPVGDLIEKIELAGSITPWIAILIAGTPYD